MAVSRTSWLANEGTKHCLLLLWLSLNVGLFWKTFWVYYHGPQYYYLHQMLGLGLCLSRASASVLNLNCSLVLLPMCRILLAYLRGSQKASHRWERQEQDLPDHGHTARKTHNNQLNLAVKAFDNTTESVCCFKVRDVAVRAQNWNVVASRKTRRLLDKSKTFHVTCGITICIFSVVHVAAHLVNALNFSVHYSEEFLALNAASFHGEDPRKLLFATVPGLTGVIMVLVLFLMSTASTYAIRVSNYDIFSYTHNLFFVFYLLLTLHVSGGVLKYQTNLKEHPPGCFNPNATVQRDSEEVGSLEYSSSEHNQPSVPGGSVELGPAIQNNFIQVCTEEPKFQAHFPETWLWISGPLCLYCAERLYRYIQSSNKPVTVTAVISHPCNVLEIRMMKEGFKARPGQYVILHCPSVSSLESHPFTLTLCPTATRATFGVHLKVVGDWTERFRDMLFLHSSWDAEILPVFQQRHYPKLYVDGPFGSPFEESFNYEVSLCVAGGIGVTPFASILRTLLDDWKCYKLRRLYFVWVCRDIRYFHCFADLLCSLHNKLWQENRPDFVNIQLYLTQTDGIQEITGEKYQVLNSRLSIRRPCWELLFNEIAKSNRRKTVGVFCCGPNKISKALHKLSNSSNSYGTRFEYNKESFS